MKQLAPFAVVITFILFLAASAVAGIVADYKKRRGALDLIRAAIERGQPADPALVERLLQAEPQRSALNPLYMLVTGIVIVAAGVGLAVFAVFISQNEAQALYPVLGAGIGIACVGAGVILGARIAERKLARATGR